MDNAALTPSVVDVTSVTTEPESSDQRASPRIQLLIRAAKLTTQDAEFVCVIRDVSETGMSARMFHELPSDEHYILHMPGGNSYTLRRVWARGQEAGFEFAQSINAQKMISEAGEYPKRGLRLDMGFSVTVSTLTQACEARVENVSQQGARFSCSELFAIDQSVKIRGAHFPEVRAKVRWRRDQQYGVVFEDTFTLGDFARFAAKVQAPELLEG